MRDYGSSNMLRETIGFGCAHCCCLGKTTWAQLFKKSVCLLCLSRDKDLPTAHDRSEVVGAWNWCCYPHTGNSLPSRWLCSSQSWSVWFFIQDKVKDVTRSAPQDGSCPYRCFERKQLLVKNRSVAKHCWVILLFLRMAVNARHQSEPHWLR